MSTILDNLAAVNADTVILVGNNLSAPDMERYLKTHSKTEKNILFGFRVTAGKREAEYVICERAGSGDMDIGFLHAAVPEQRKRTMEQLVRGTGYRLRWHDDMESFFKCHVAAILTMIGELMTAAHCRHAVSEMEALDNAWTELRKQVPDFPTPNWDALRGTMPDWETLHQQYENKEGGASRWNATKKCMTS